MHELLQEGEWLMTGLSTLGIVGDTLFYTVQNIWAAWAAGQVESCRPYIRVTALQTIHARTICSTYNPAQNELGHCEQRHTL